MFPRNRRLTRLSRRPRPSFLRAGRSPLRSGTRRVVPRRVPLGCEALEDRRLLAVTLEASPLILLEDGGSSVLTARLSSANPDDVTVNLALSGTATENTDYTIGSTQLVIPAGQLSASTQATALADEVADDDETIVVDVDSVTNDTEEGTQRVTLRIVEQLDAGEIRGFAYFDFDGNGVRDADEPGVPGVRVNLDGQTSAGDPLPLEVMTADDGSFGFIDLPPGAYSVTFARPLALLGGTAAAGSAGGTASGAAVTDIELDQDEASTDYAIHFPSLRSIFATSQFLMTSRPPLDELYRELIARAEEMAGEAELAERIRGGETVSNPSVRSAAGVSAPVVQLSANPLQIAEDGGSATVTATLSSATSQDVTVALSFGGSATRDEDYSAAASQIVIPAGQISGTLVITATDDDIEEADETIQVQVTSATGARVSGTQQVTITIVDDEEPTGEATVTLSAGSAEIDEDEGSTTVTATLSRSTTEEVTVHLGFGGTATRGVDYEASAEQIVISAGDTTSQITVTAIQDALDELNETIVVAITSVDGAQEQGQQTAGIRIRDDDPSPTVSISSSAETIDEASGSAQITATLSAVSGQPVTVDLSFSGTAQVGVDYQRSGQRITIPAGQSSASITVTALEDDIDEADETIVVTATNVVGASLSGSASTTITIIDEDLPSIQLTVSDSELDEDGDQAVVRAVLPAPVDEDVIVTLGFQGSATNELDYTRSGTQITIPAGEVSGQITIDTVDDELNEGDETIVIEVIDVVNASASQAQPVTVTIIDDDPLPVVTLSASDTTLEEQGGVVAITVTLDAVSGRDVTVELAVDGTATAGVDYELDLLEIVVPAGELSAQATVSAIDDLLDESDETIVIDIAAVENGLEDDVQRVTLTILDDDDLPTVSISGSAATLAEDGGQVTVTAELSAPSGRQVVVDLELNGTAEKDADYTISSQQIVIPAGQATGSVVITALDDQLDEGNETIQLEVSSASNADFFPPEVVDLTIIDDDSTAAAVAPPPALDPGPVDQVFCEPVPNPLNRPRSICVP